MKRHNPTLSTAGAPFKKQAVVIDETGSTSNINSNINKSSNNEEAYAKFLAEISGL